MERLSSKVTALPAEPPHQNNFICMVVLTIDIVRKHLYRDSQRQHEEETLIRTRHQKGILHRSTATVYRCRGVKANLVCCGFVLNVSWTLFTITAASALQHPCEITHCRNNEIGTLFWGSKYLQCVLVGPSTAAQLPQEVIPKLKFNCKVNVKKWSKHKFLNVLLLF